MWKHVMHTLQLTLEALLKIWSVVSQKGWRQAQHQQTLSARLPLGKPHQGPAVSNKQKPVEQFTRSSSNGRCKMSAVLLGSPCPFLPVLLPPRMTPP